MGRAQPFDANPLPRQPFAGHASTQHEGFGRLVLIGEEVERGADIVGRDPGMGKIAEEADDARFAADHFGPGIPPGRAAILHVEAEQVIGALRLAEAQHGGDVAKLIGRVIRPVG